MEVPIQGCQITIIQIRLDLYLSQNMLLNFCIADPLL
jgi:hypothetical protein